MLEELHAGATGSVEVSDQRLEQLVRWLIDYEYDPPPGTEDVLWSEPLADAAALLSGRSDLQDRACLVDGLRANRLDIEGRRSDALAAFEAACSRYGDDEFYKVFLLVDWGTLLRDENRFREALDRLREAEAFVRFWRAHVTDLDRDAASYLDYFEVTVQNELGVAAHELGMSDVAAEHLARAATLAQAIADPAASAALWGANLVYRLNSAIELHDFRAAGAMAVEYQESPRRALLPATTDAQIHARLAMVETARSWQGELPPGSGERELLALRPELAQWPGEEARACAWVARSMLDRGEIAGALKTARAGLASLSEAGEHEPLRLQLLAMEARALLDANDPDGARTLYDDALLPAAETFLDRWSHSPIEAGGSGLLAWGRWREAFGELLRLDLRLNPGAAGRERAFERVVRLQAVGTFAREHGVPAPDLATIRRELLEPGRALLCWFPGRVRSHLFFVDGSDVRHFELGPLRILGQAALDLQPALHAVLRNPQGKAENDRLDRALLAARNAFLPPAVLESLRELEAIDVVGLVDFGYVPIELLSLGSDPSEAIGMRLVVAHQPSVPVGVWLARLGRASTGPSGGVRIHLGAGRTGGEQFGELAPLQAGPQDLARLVADYRKARIPFQSTVAPAALDLWDLDVGVLQIIAHGLYDPSRVRPAGLLLDPSSEQGAVFASDLDGHTGLPPLVVVTACGAGRAHLRRGDDGRGHLRGALFAAGARCAVLSVAEVELGASLRFSEHLHHSLAGGATVGQALLDARRAAHSDGDRDVELHALLAHAWGFDRFLPFPRATQKGPRAAVCVTAALAAVGALGFVALRLRGRG